MDINNNSTLEYDNKYGDDFICKEEAELLTLLTNPSVEEIIEGVYNDQILQEMKDLQEKIKKKVDSEK
jgi:hypothetical protein